MPEAPADHVARLDPAGEIEVWAAGGLIRRERPAGGALGEEVLVIHRPHRHDWSLPKGKLDPGETLASAARREVSEETGLDCEVGELLAIVRYVDHKGRSKAVAYFEMTVIGGSFEVNDEVDEIRWVPPASAAALLTYRHDADLIERVAVAGHRAGGS